MLISFQESEFKDTAFLYRVYIIQYYTKYKLPNIVMKLIFIIIPYTFSAPKNTCVSAHTAHGGPTHKYTL